jgi:hypothetical protein
VIVDDDVVIGFAGDTPPSAINRVAELRGLSVDEIEDALLSLSGEMNRMPGISKNFLVVVRRPTPRISRSFTESGKMNRNPNWLDRRPTSFQRV